MRNLTVPIADEAIRDLMVGDSVRLNGIMITARDSVHKWIIETFIKETCCALAEDTAVYERIKPILDGGLIYHCGPVVSGLDTKEYGFVAAGPTTSTREEPYQGAVMRHFNIKGVIGKGGMGANTLKACGEVPGVYFHTVGGAGTLIARSVIRVLEVHKLDFGVPEAIWVIEVKDFPAVVTMDAHGNSLHAEVAGASKQRLDGLLAG